MDELLSRYERTRERSRALFRVLSDDAYYSQPIALRHPIVFYDGHLPAFSFNTLVKKALGGPSIDAALESLFARGIDPGAETAGGATDHRAQWPDRDTVRQFTEEADSRVARALARVDLDRPQDPLLDRAEAAHAIIEHEAMHQETLLYMWHRLPFEQKQRPVDYAPRIGGSAPPLEWIDVPPGIATLGVDRAAIPFGWDNEFPACRVDVAPFSIERHDVTNERYLEFVEAGGYRDARWWHPEDWKWIQSEKVLHPIFWERHDGVWQWRTMFASIPLPPAWPVYVSQAEASAYARWRGTRLPTEAEYQRSAFGSPRSASASLAEARSEPHASGGGRPHPWGDAPPSKERGVFDFMSWDPEPAGTHPAGASAWGIDDLVGNGWKWTSTTFGPFPGFRRMASYPEYSADFFDGEHFVLKGASPVTARELLRPTFRNWFRARYPYVYATFRCVR